jgi:hypothetical protein
MNLKEVEKIVGSIQTHIFKSSNSFSVGSFKTQFRGTGLQFREHQVYNPGDEVRFIDWKVSARTNTTYIKTFEEERNVEISILIDINRSMLYGYNGVSKLQAALELACLIYLLAHQTKDKVRTYLVGEEILSTPLSEGRVGITQLVKLLKDANILDQDGKVNILYQAPKVEMDLKDKISFIKSHLMRKKEIVIFSDFYYFLPEKELGPLFFKKNLHAYAILAPLDKTHQLPFVVHAEDSTEKTFKKTSPISTMGNKDVFERWKGKINTLDVSQRYLDDFVKHIR